MKRDRRAVLSGGGREIPLSASSDKRHISP
jgi:hypothetical protein